MTSSTHYSLKKLLIFFLVPLVSSQSTPNASLLQPAFNSSLTTVDIWYTPPRFYGNGTLEAPQSITPRQRRISYRNIGGLAIIQGDVVLGTVAQVQAAVANPRGKVRPRGISIQHNNRLNKWHNGVVVYKYESTAFENKRKQQFDAAIKLWTDRLPFLYFQKEPASPDKVAGGAITLIPGPDGGTTSYSPLGKAGWVVNGVFQYSAESNVMTLAQCDASLEACAAHYAHEIGHTLGLYHEHNRPDRDQNVVIHCDRIPGYTAGNAAQKDALCSAYVKENAADVDYTGPYDRNSIMHYGTGSFYGVNGQKIMEGLPPFPDPNPGLTPTRYDVIKICDLYSEVCQAICGDGILSPGEKCDDGNNIDNDGCAANCQSSTNTLCGNGRLDPGEECDFGPNNGGQGQACGLDCKRVTTPGTPTTPESPCAIPTCNPNPGENKCHITSSCIPVDGSPSKPRHLCACPHGFRGLGVSPGDPNSQVRIPAEKWPSQKGRVFVKPGVHCAQLCDAWTLGADGCIEVQQSGGCF